MEKEPKFLRKNEGGNDALELPNDKNREISEEEIGRKLARLGDIGELADKTDYPFDRESIEALARLVIKLEDKLPDYDAVLSDEASGRLPSLFLRKIINHIRLKNGLPPAQIYFLASGRPIDRKNYAAKVGAIRDLLTGKKGGINKALVVTEYVSKGDSLAELLGLVKEAGIDFDAAAVSARGKSERYSWVFGDAFKKVVYGRDCSNAGLAFFSRSSASGVEKDFRSVSPHPESVFRQIEGDKASELLGEDKDKKEAYRRRCAREMKKAREDIDFLAEKFYQLLD